ncbi:kinase-like protein, partial [Amniculicola lignicola CBS 123094]
MSLLRLAIKTSIHQASLCQLTSRTGTRMASTITSTIVGKSGRIYTIGNVIREHPQVPHLKIYKAESENESFVVKRVPEQFHNLSKQIASEVDCSRHLRIHVDCQDGERFLIYRYFKTTMLPLIQDHPEIPAPESLKILRNVGEAIQELHAKDWLHNDVKPDNILVDWESDSEGNMQVTDALLGDFDISYNLPPGAVLQSSQAIGNVMWRSPEGQTGRGITKASDVYSFGLVLLTAFSCLFAFGGGPFLIINNINDMIAKGISPEQEILTRHFTFFGLPPEALFKQINSEEWTSTLTLWSKIAEEIVRQHPEDKFESWGQDMPPDVYSAISAMTNIDPTARPTMAQVLAHEWWTNE